MLLRRTTPLALALFALACEPSVPYDPAHNNPSSVDYAVFDPAPDSFDKSPADIPLPNDLALQPDAIATQPAAQAEVLKSFAAQGGWPADQDLPITFDFVHISIDAKTGASTRSAPSLDLSSINAGNLAVFSLTASGVTPVAFEAPTYTVNGDHGTLTILRKADAAGLRHYPPATYVAAVRGGPSGVKLIGGGTLEQRPAMYLITQGVDLSQPQNQGLITCDPPVPCTRDMKAAKGAQLEALRQAYAIPFQVLQAAGIPTKEIAAMTAFTITPAVRVVADPVAAALGVPNTLPFPSDFLLDPTTHHLLPAVADPVKGPFGTLGPALATLDGFSTTGLITAGTSGVIDPTTVNKDSVFLYEFTVSGPRRIPEAAEGPAANPGFVAASTQLVAPGTSVTNVIGLQPAVPVPLPAGSPAPVLALPALDDASEYAVVITDGIKTPGGAKIAQATLGRLLALSQPLLAGGAPTVAGLDPAQAAQLEPLRQALAPVLDDLAATKNVTRDHVLMAYTFRTQSGIKTTGTQLAALPYSAPASTAQPVSAATYSCQAGNTAPVCTGAPLVTATLSQYGVNPTVVPNGDIGYIYEAKVVTFNKLLCNAGDSTCTDTGAFSPPTVNPVAEPINVLITVPAACTPTTPCTAPLVVYRHGVGDSRRDMLFVANQLNKAGFVVAAIDGAKHGDRSYCQANAECAAGGTCVPDPTLANEGDAPQPTPGKCSTAGTPSDFVRDTTTCPSCTNTKSTPLASSNFLVSFNLFRTRDSLRQDIIDQSQLIRLLSPNPACVITAPPTDAAHTCANALISAGTGAQIDPKKIYFLGQSLGAMQGVADSASNPRVAKTALNVGGATIVDVFANGSFSVKLNALLASKGLDKAHNPSGYVQFLTVSKWVLDPAEPLNFAGHLIRSTLSFPAPLSALAPAPSTRPTLGQMALCDQTVPNPFNLELYGVLGLGPASATASTLTTFVKGGNTTCPAGAINHGFLLDWATYGAGGIEQQAQDDIAAFFNAGTLPPPARSAP